MCYFRLLSLYFALQIIWKYSVSVLRASIETLVDRHVIRKETEQIILHSYALARHVMLFLACITVHRYYPSTSVRDRPRRSYDRNKFDIPLRFGFLRCPVVLLSAITSGIMAHDAA